MSQRGVGTSPYGYAWEWTDATGLEYLRARYYSPYRPIGASKHMHQYHYRGVQRFGIGLLQLSGLVTISFTTLFAAWLIFAMFQVNPSAPETVFCLCIWSIVLGWTLGLAMVNILPIVWIDDAGLFISPFHRVYGWLYSRTFFPSFVISKGIEDYEQLVQEFKRRALMARKQ